MHNVAAGILISLLFYNEIAPPAHLAPFVRCLWRLRGEGDGSPERILPDGSFELIVHHGAPMASGGRLQPHSMLMGEIRRPVIVRSSGPIDVSGLRFRIGGASAFFDVPMTEVRDRIVSIEDVRPRQMPRVHPRWAMVRESVRRMRVSNIRMRDLAASIGVTERTMGRAFQDVAGIGPKRLARILRFQRSLRSEDGFAYYDQSHRIHEFRELAGVTPSEFWRERHAINDAFVGNLQS